MNAKALMVQGTGSGVGKSFLAAGLCRILSDMGIRVAPFKAQNMALNSYVTFEGGEIGRAQAFQAEAARVDALNDMNPVLLKVESDAGCQVILGGKLHGSMTAREYYAFRDTVRECVTAAYDRLSSKFDVIIMEGAGSPAEINLAREDIVNMSMARHAGAPVLLVGDIEKGGVFASLYGTLGLLDGDAELIRAFVINKFRGDESILKSGLNMIKEKTGRPVIGVLPYMGEMWMHEEDGIPESRLRRGRGRQDIRISVVLFEYISNFTDFDPFMFEPDVDVHYTVSVADLEMADLIILPGSKNTMKDLSRLREDGLDKALLRLSNEGKPIIGLCGGYQMMGRKILDPEGLESGHAEIEGLGLLDTVTTLKAGKTTRRINADVKAAPPGLSSNQGPLCGYEIHIGHTDSTSPLFNFRSPDGLTRPDGASKGNCWGTYLHGIFDNDKFRRDLIDWLRQRKGLDRIGIPTDCSGHRSKAIDHWADVLRENLDMNFILDMLEAPA